MDRRTFLGSAATVAMVGSGAVSTRAAPSRSILGAYPGADPSDSRRVEAFERWLGSRFGVVVLYVNADAERSVREWFLEEMSHAWQAGHVPMVTWLPYTGDEESTPATITRRIRDGGYDAVIERWASVLSSWLWTDDPVTGGPRRLYFRPLPEMNGDWLPWSVLKAGDETAFVDAWRRVHGLMMAEIGSDERIQWLWNPNATEHGAVPTEASYPDDAYVDWVGIDGYNWGDARSSSVWQSPAEVFDPMRSRLVDLADKPLAASDEERGPQTTVDRRTYLKGVGAASALSGLTFSGTSTASASTSGYGEFGYGGIGSGDGVDDPAPARLATLVTDADGEPLEGVEIVIYADGEAVKTGRTDADGEATVELDTGVYDVEASKEGYHVETEKAVETTDGETTSTVITLEARSSPFKLVVCDEEGEPIAGSDVEIYDEDETPVVAGETDDRGCFEAELAPGVYDARVSKDGFETRTLSEIQVTAGEPTTAMVLLEESSTAPADLTVRVTDGADRGIEGAAVSVEAEDGEIAASGETDEEGRVTFELEPARYTVTVSDGDYDDSATQTVELEAEEETTVSFTFDTTDPELAVRTAEADDVSRAEATLRSELVTLEEVEAYFQYRAVGTLGWESTARTTKTSTGTFEERVSGLSTDTDYEYRAVAKNDEKDLRSTGTETSFRTEKSDVHPTVDRLGVDEVSPPNPHADVEVDWAVSHDDGLLDAVLIHVEEVDGSEAETKRVSVDGETASGVDTIRVRHGAGGSYRVTLTVIATNNEHASRTATVDA